MHASLSKTFLVKLLFSTGIRIPHTQAAYSKQGFGLFLLSYVALSKYSCAGTINVGSPILILHVL